jgi:hypothetical protein
VIDFQPFDRRVERPALEVDISLRERGIQRAQLADQGVPRTVVNRLAQSRRSVGQRIEGACQKRVIIGHDALVRPFGRRPEGPVKGRGPTAMPGPEVGHGRRSMCHVPAARIGTREPVPPISRGAADHRDRRPAIGWF